MSNNRASTGWNAKNVANLDPLPREALQDRLLKGSAIHRTTQVESMTVKQTTTHIYVCSNSQHVSAYSMPGATLLHSLMQ